MNIKKILTTGVASAVLLGNLAMPAFAAAFSNGGFETGTDPGVFSTEAPGSTDITGWNVDSGSIDYIGTYWTAAEGTRSIDLSGNDAGTISQAFDTVIGATYTVSFALSGNPAGGPDEKTLNISATGGGTTPFSYNIVTNANSLVDMKWATEQYVFVATSTSSTLTFASTTAGFFGPAIDNVVIDEDLSTVPTNTPTPTPDPYVVPEECEGIDNLGVPIVGTEGSEVLTGTPGNDLIFALGGSDIVNGNNGNDCIVGGNGSDLLHGNNGHDVVIGGEGSDAINGHNGNDDLYGGSGSDSLKGGSGNDDLWGEAGSDSLKGEAGTDEANGGTESDYCNAETEDASCEA